MTQRTLAESPVLQSTTKSKKKKYWQGVAFSTDEGCFCQKRWWQEGSKRQESAPTQVFGKNIGRTNETTPEEQAVLKLKSMISKQRDKSYSEDGSATHIHALPMLAHKYNDHRHKIIFPCYVQPKLDGFRLLQQNGDAWTRKSKDLPNECIKHLLWDTGGLIVDGELVLPSMVDGERTSLQQIAAAAKKFDHVRSPKLVHWVYDLISDEPFSKRIAELQRRLHDVHTRGFAAQVQLVVTERVDNHEEIQAFYEKCIGLGFEGIMVRHSNAGYTIKHRVDHLLKLKPFEDAEFKIIEVYEGTGGHKGLAIFKCDAGNGNGSTVSAVPKGTHEYRAQLWRDRKKLIGKILTIKYQYLSDENIPVFTTGLGIREDL